MPHLVGSVLFGDDEAVTEFVRARIPHMQNGFGPCTALGVVRGGHLVAGVVYYNYRGFEIHVGAAADRASWALPKTLTTLFFYPLEQLGCVRMTAITGRNNKRTRRFLKGLGFKEEGVHLLGLDGRTDAISYGMLKKDCRWLRNKANV